MTEKEVLEIIDKAEKEGVTKLYLHNKGIKELTGEIGMLTNLQVLNLGNNQLAKLPVEIERLTNLQVLNLVSNQLAELPGEIGRLTNLQKLNLRYNKLAELPGEIGRLTSLQELDLDRNQLTELSGEIGGLTNLWMLNLIDNQLAKLPGEIGRLINLQELNLTNNQLRKLPDEIGNLTNLRTLKLYGNKLTELPGEIGRLTNLQVLTLGKNELAELPGEIGRLTNLQELNLNDNQLAELQGEIGRLKNLRTLKLYNNQLAEMPEEIGELTKLQSLELGSNELAELPGEIGRLTNLQVLGLSDNQLAELPGEIGELTNLKKINLSYNKLTSVSAELGQLSNLMMFDLINNRITELPPELGQLTKLEKLNLGGNTLESPPPEVVKQGLDAVREYLKSLEAEKQTLNEVKVLLVGKGGAGKTSLVKRLTGKKFDSDEPQTTGVNIVNIEDWQVGSKDKRIKVHFWDFGGQDIMQATHQMFYSLRSLYILVLNAREEPEAEDWLKHIESFGGESPILVVINKIDENPNYDVNRKSLLEKYKGIKDFYRLSCKTGEGVEAFSLGLQKEIDKVEMVRSLWGKDWLKVKEELEKSKKDYITYGGYEEVCRKANVKEEKAQRTLLGYLHSLGVILHFEGFDVQDTQVLNPAWVTEAVYRIINSKRLSENKGYLRKQWLGEILREKGRIKGKRRLYSPNEERNIIDLMGKFELCFELDEDRDTVLVPDLLDEQEPGFDFEEDGCVDFYFEYDFLPKSVVPRFMVRRHRDIEGRLCWRSGAVLHDEEFGVRALVRADKQQKRIYIRVNGRQKRDYFSTIRKTFLDINAGFKKLEVKHCIRLGDNDRVEYDELIGCELEGQDTILRIKSGKRFKVSQLLGQIESRRETQLIIDKIIATDKAHIEVGAKISGGIVATGRSRINIEIKIEQAIEHLEELKKIVEGQPEEKLPAVVKNKVFEIIYDALKDVAKRQLKEAAKKIWDLGKDVGPLIVKTAGYDFFRNMLEM